MNINFFKANKKENIIAEVYSSRASPSLSLSPTLPQVRLLLPSIPSKTSHHVFI